MTRSTAGTRRRLVFATLVAVCALAGWLLRDAIFPVSDPIRQPSAVPAPQESSQRPSEFTGSEACRECHQEQSDSYRRTAHSRSLGGIDPQTEPPNAEFRHAASGRSYRVRRVANQLRHHESFVAPDGTVVAETEYAVRYLIGSGRHTRSYAVEADGFLMESPVTWYSSPQAWRMSPGYYRPQHWGFERATDLGCLYCHVGRAERTAGALHRLTIHEQAIGCENCHGSGVQHAQRQRRQSGIAQSVGDDENHGSASVEPDLFVVHPGRLDRDLAEAICANCHLRGDATVSVPDRDVGDFQPGRRLTEFRIDYRLEVPKSTMKVVGHVEQMRRSRCYQNSTTLTCMTCHDPHAPLNPADKVTVYRKKCLSCHGSDGCRLKSDERLRTSAEDDCTACHMPKGPTEIPHVAFTHHRIGLHDATQEADAAPHEIGVLVPFDDVSHLSAADRDRCLGLGYLELSDKQADAAAFRTYRQRALELLEQEIVRSRNDPEVNDALARLFWDQDPVRAIEFAQAAIRSEKVSPRSRVNSLFVVSDGYFRTNRPQLAVEQLEQLVHLRRHSEDWLLLGLCRSALGKHDAALAALLTAAEISPYRSEIQEALAYAYRQIGKHELAGRHQDQSRRLTAVHPS